MARAARDKGFESSHRHWPGSQPFPTTPEHLVEFGRADAMHSYPLFVDHHRVAVNDSDHQTASD
jgi:hypothetical protein